MNQEPNWFWKNWRMGTELQISGSFIYNAIYTLDQMESLYYEEECFEFLYNASVGIERLLKIAIILSEHDKINNQEDFEKSLITHSSAELLNRLQSNHKINLGKSHNKFLSLIDHFYKSIRYGRFSIQSVYKKPGDKYGLISFLEDELNLEIKTDIMNTTPVTSRIRKFIGKIIGKFTTQLYAIVKEEAYRNRTFTYEIAYSSKAFKIFMAKEFDFTNERIVQRESLLHLLKSDLNKNIASFIKEIPQINMGGFNTNKYIQSVFKYEKDRQVMEEIQYLYEEDKPDMKRLEELAALGSEVNFDFFDDEWEEE